jgi:hypothetical protein
VPAAAAEPAPAPVLETPTPAEARALVQAFRLAYEDRDVERLVGLFAPDATENGRSGLDAIAQAYRDAFAHIDDVQYALRDPDVSIRDGRAVVRGPFTISYSQPPAGSGEMHGTAAWQIVRRDGAARIVALDYEFAPGPAAPQG